MPRPPRSSHGEPQEPLHSQFMPTSWTAVTAAQQSGSPGAGEALAQLCQVYWPPLFAYVRRLGHPEEDAKDLTQQFFLVLLDKNYLGAANRTKGKFRTFLLSALNHFLANEWDRTRAQKRGGGQALISLDAEAESESGHVEPATHLSPLKLFERSWARTVFREALKQLEQEYARAGKTHLLDGLKGFLDEATPSGQYTEPAARLGMTTGAVRVAVHRLRQRYGEFIRAEVARTLVQPTQAEIDQEVQHLFDAFSAA